jgi:hypothetical protein
VPKTVLVTTVKPMERGGMSYPAGARVPVSVIDALTLKRRGVVTLTRKAEAPGRAAGDAPVLPSRGRRYRRRDLQAEEPTTVEISPSPAPSSVPSPPAVPPDEER